MLIRDWVEQTFSRPGPKLFLELGAHRGEDTAWLAAIEGATVHAFEPDPRIVYPDIMNVTWHRLAVTDHDGPCEWWRSQSSSGQPNYVASSSTRRPTWHLKAMPRIKFHDTPIKVQGIRLDTWVHDREIDRVDFIWCDIQGAERDMIAGGQRVLGMTRYLYTEVVERAEYDGQATREELLGMLPGWQVVERYRHDVLLSNNSCPS